MGSLYWIIPPLFSLVSSIISKKIIPSIFLGLLIGCYLKADGNLLKGVDLISYYIVGAITDENNSSVVIFLFCFGALSEIFTVGGGISGFTKKLQQYINSERGAYLSVWLVTPLTFFDCCFHVISTGIISKTILEKTHSSRDRLAFIINITSSQLVPLIPLATTYVGYILGILTPILIQSNLQINSYSLYLQAIPYNFYSITMVFFSLLVTFHNFESIKILQPAYKKMTITEGEHQEHEAEHQHTFEEKVPPTIINLALPLVLLISLLMYLIWRSGVGNGGTSFFNAMVLADYNQAILSATLITLILTTILYSSQKVSMKTLQTAFFSGGFELLPPIIIIILAWSLTLLSIDLGFYKALSGISQYYLPSQLLPLILFAISGLTSYFIGSSWATWALLLPIAVSLGVSSSINLPLVVGSVLAGGSIGDSISPLGEEPLLVASIMDLPLARHISYVTPYGIISALLSALGYLVAGYLL